MTQGENAGSPVAIVSVPASSVALQSPAPPVEPAVEPAAAVESAGAIEPAVEPAVVSAVSAESSLPHAARTSAPTASAGTSRRPKRADRAGMDRLAERRMRVSSGSWFTLGESYPGDEGHRP